MANCCSVLASLPQDDRIAVPATSNYPSKEPSLQRHFYLLLLSPAVKSLSEKPSQLFSVTPSSSGRGKYTPLQNHASFFCFFLHSFCKHKQSTCLSMSYRTSKSAHFLAAGDAESNTGDVTRRFTGKEHHCIADVFVTASAPHRDLIDVRLMDILNVLRTGNFTGFQVLDKQTLRRVCP